jgi:hypothetical protein
MFDKATLHDAKDALNEQRVLPDGGNDLPGYLLTDNYEFESFHSRLHYEVPCSIAEDLDDEEVPVNGIDNTMLNYGRKGKLDFSQLLHAGIVNLDAYLSPDWNEFAGIDQYMKIRGKAVAPYLDEVTIHLQLDITEVIKGARQRGKEDGLHALYILGGWIYKARKADHIGDGVQKLVRAFFRLASNDPSAPEDASKEDHRGGAE